MSVIELLTERRVAEILACSPDTVARMRRSGEIPFVRVGRRTLRYRREAIETWIREREVTPDGMEDLHHRGREIMDEVVRGL